MEIKVKCYNRNHKCVTIRATCPESDSDEDYVTEQESESETESENEDDEISESEDGTDYESETEPESDSESLDDPAPYFGQGFRVYFDSHADKKKFMTAFGFR